MSQNPDDRPTFKELTKQLTELITLPIDSHLPKTCQSTITSKNSSIIKEDKNDLQEQDLSNTDNCQEINEPSPSLVGMSVKSRRNYFEQIIGSQKSLSPVKSLPIGKSTEIILPREELIKVKFLIL
ncbi:unnamed protein product [Rotaria sp. Silwood1]|nr:unnamed protein product [Rotaria sp. Silwood1]